VGCDLDPFSFSVIPSFPSPFTSVFHAKQTAILKAIQFTKENYIHKSFLIISDCLSALQSISSAPASMGNSLALHIIILLHSIPQSSFQFLWIPSHVGIEHKEVVDTMAKNAIISGSSCEILPPPEIRHIAKKSSIHDWNFHFPKSSNNASSMYLSIQGLLPTTPWYTHFKDLRRKNIVKVNRLRFGHNMLPLPPSASNRTYRFVQLSFSPSFH